MNLPFYKYHGAGNDFIMIDSRNLDEKLFGTEVVHQLCKRHFGIGADGLILLLNDDKLDFRMKYFNSDGKEGTMCGNGGRCFAAFVKQMELVDNYVIFSGIDGAHEARIKNERVELKMIDVHPPEKLDDGYLINTGSKHFIVFREDIDDLDVFHEGRKLRYQPRFGPDGTNVNFVSLTGANRLKMRTYERGVENETLACGTGAVAAAISSYIHTGTDKNSFEIHARGGMLDVRFEPVSVEMFTHVWLEGPARFVYKGEVDIPRI